MPLIRYKPRLKKSLLKRRPITFLKNNTKNLKKQKWRLTLKWRIKRYFIRTIRNDVAAQRKRVLRLQNRHTQLFRFKQKLTRAFNTITNKSLKNFFSSLSKKRFLKQSMHLFNTFLELRLDTVLLKTNFVITLHQARWLISSGCISMNNKRVAYISQKLRYGDWVRITK